MNEPLIEVRDLTIGWGHVALLRNLTFTVYRGDIFVIMGGSGSGKSTLLRNLIGLEQPLSGSVVMHEPRRDPIDGRPNFGVMFQSGALLGSMTVAENVALPLSEWTDLPEDAIDAVVRAKLRLVGLEDSGAKLPAELSGGMRKRAALARALVLDSSLLFLDEPSAGLDPVSSAELDSLIHALSTGLGVTVVMVTHELDSVFAIGTRCILLDAETQGIIAQGDPRVLRASATDPRVRRFLHRGRPRDAEASEAVP
jgi:phospholipid/cholesterol/gamma-HCH transport system ATP-binding protein